MQRILQNGLYIQSQVSTNKKLLFIVMKIDAFIEFHNKI